MCPIFRSLEEPLIVVLHFNPGKAFSSHPALCKMPVRQPVAISWLKEHCVRSYPFFTLTKPSSEHSHDGEVNCKMFALVQASCTGLLAATIHTDVAAVLTHLHPFQEEDSSVSKTLKRVGSVSLQVPEGWMIGSSSKLYLYTKKKIPKQPNTHRSAR